MLGSNVFKKKQKYFKYNRIVSGIMILCAFIVTFVVLIYNVINIEGQPIMTKAFQRSIEMGTVEFKVELLNPIEQTDMSDDQTVSWWECAGTYYFFLPGAWKNNDIYWIFNLEDKICIDGSEVVNGSEMNLMEGKHEIELPSGEYFPIEILYSGNISSMFVKIKGDKALEYLHKDKQNVTDGNYVLFDEQGNCDRQGNIESFSCRGNASFWYSPEKKSYVMNLEEKTDIFGFGSSKKWLLISNYFDKTYMRNMLVNELAECVGMKYTPQMEYVDLYINGEYIGNYLISEKIEVDSKRVDIYDLSEEIRRLNPNQRYKYINNISNNINGINELKWNSMDMEPQNIEGGYLLEVDFKERYDEEVSGFISPNGRPVVIQEPQYTSFNQTKYIGEIYSQFENAICDEQGINPNTGCHYTEYVNLESFAAHYYLDEFSKQLDAGRTSFYFYKPLDSNRLYAGPVWDYDKSLGSEFTSDTSPEGFFAAVRKFNGDVWYEMYKHNDFQNVVKEKYNMKYKEATLEVCDKWLTQMTEKIETSVVMDIMRYHMNDEKPDKERAYRLFDKEVKQLKDFTEKRIEFLDEEWSR